MVLNHSRAAKRLANIFVNLSGMQLPDILFLFFSIGAVVFSLLMITRKSAVVAALMLVMTFCMLAGLYLTLNAPFLAVIQVAVYAGAIMVLVLFVIMLLNLQAETIRIRTSVKAMVGIAAAVGFL